MNMRIDHKPCLVLNADYSPVAIVNWQRAIIWSYRLNHSTEGLSMDIIEYYKKDFIKGAIDQTPLPAVIKIRNYLKLHKHSVNFSRKKNLLTPSAQKDLVLLSSKKLSSRLQRKRLLCCYDIKTFLRT